jgi:hypothetical protein
MKTSKQRNSKVLIIAMLIGIILTTNFLTVFAATDENNSISYFDRLIQILNTSEKLTDIEYRELLTNTLEENPYFLVSLNDEELDALEKIYQQVFKNLLTIHINTNDVSLTFFGIALLADLDTLLHDIPVDLYIEATSTLKNDQLNTIKSLIDKNDYQEPFDVFLIAVKSIIQAEETLIQEPSIPIRMLRYNILIMDDPAFIKAYSIHQNTTEEIETTIFSTKVMKIKTTTLDGFALVSTQQKTTIVDKPLGLFDFTIDKNRLIVSGLLILGVGTLISYLMVLAIKTKKQVEAKD